MIPIWKMIRARAQRSEIYSQASFWDEKAKKYSGREASMWPNKLLNRHYRHEQFGFINRTLPSVQGWQVLDIGCGTGDLSRYFASRGALVAGVDFSSEALAWARKLGGEGIRYVQGSAYDLDGLEGFDLAATLGVMTVACRTRADVERLLGRIFQVLKPGGHLLILEPLHRGPLRRVLKMSAAEFRDCLERAGFRIVVAEELHCWPIRVLLAYVRWPRWMTILLARLGLSWMRRHRRRRMGDYQAMLACKT